MGLSGDRGKIEPDQAQALSHPIRLRIMELFRKDTDRTLAAQSLAADLITDFPKVKVRQVAYHVAVLKDAQLIPAGWPVPAPSRSTEDDASFKGMGQTITVLREQRGMDRDTFAAKIEEERAALEKIERGEVNADWGTLRAVARVLCLPLDVLIELAEECAPGPGGEEWRRWTREVVQERADEVGRG